MDGEFEVEKEILVDVVNGVGPVTVLKTWPWPWSLHSIVDDGYRIVTRLLEQIPMSVESLDAVDAIVVYTY
jgi:hypothetical protein